MSFVIAGGVMGAALGPALEVIAWTLVHGWRPNGWRPGSAQASCGPRWPEIRIVRLAVTTVVCALVGMALAGSCEPGHRDSWAFVLATCLVIVSLTDVDARVIPNSVLIAFALVRTVGVIAVDVIHAVAPLETMWSLLRLQVLPAIVVVAGLGLLSAAFQCLVGRGGIGGGDIKLLGVIALYHGVERTLVVTTLACTLGVVWWAVIEIGPRLVRRRLSEGSLTRMGLGVRRGEDAGGVAGSMEGVDTSFPWAPSISIACLMCILAGSA